MSNRTALVCNRRRGFTLVELMIVIAIIVILIAIIMPATLVANGNILKRRCSWDVHRNCLNVSWRRRKLCPRTNCPSRIQREHSIAVSRCLTRYGVALGRQYQMFLLIHVVNEVRISR